MKNHDNGQIERDTDMKRDAETARGTKIQHQAPQQQQTRQDPIETSAKASKGKRQKAVGTQSHEQNRDMQTAQGTSELRHDDSTSIGSEDQRDQADGSISTKSTSPSKTAESMLPENDRESVTAEGNYNAADGHHTEEVPRTKGKNGIRVSTTDGQWSSTSKSQSDKH